MPGPTNADFEVSLKFRDLATGKFVKASDDMIKSINKTGMSVAKNGKMMGEEMKRAGTKYSEASRKMRLSTTDLQLAIGRLRNQMLLVFFAYQTIKNVIGPAIDAAIKQEFAERKLEAAFYRTGLAGQQQVKNLKELASQLQKNTMFGDEAIINAEAMLASYKLNAEQVSKMTPLLLDMATATRNVTGQEIDLQTIAIAVGKAIHGQVGSLTRYGVVLTETEKKQHTVEQISAALERAFGGIAKAMGATFIGQITMTKNAMGDFAEQLGMIITKSPMLIAAIDLMREGLISRTTELIKAKEESQNFLRVWQSIVALFIIIIESTKGVWRSFLEGVRVFDYLGNRFFALFTTMSIKMTEFIINFRNNIDRYVIGIMPKIAAVLDFIFKDPHKDAETLTQSLERMKKELEDLDKEAKKLEKGMVDGGDAVTGTWDNIIATYEKVIKKMEEMGDADKAILDKMKQNVQSLADETTKVWDYMLDITKGLAGNMESAFEELFFDAFTNNLKTVWDYVDAFAKDVVRMFSKILAQMLVMQLMPVGYEKKGPDWMSAILGFLGIAGGGAGAATSGMVAASAAYTGVGAGFGAGILHTGGYIGKNRIQRFQTGGIVPALLEQGEGVINRYGMSKIGRSGLERLNRGQGAEGGGQTIVYIQAIDVKSFRDHLMQNQDIYVSSVHGNLESNSSLRKLFKSGI